MSNEEKVKEWVRGKDKELSALHGINEHGKFFLSPDIRKQIINVFTSDSDLALIDREKERPKFYPRGTTGVNPILPVQVNIPKVIKDLYDSYQPVIPLAKALKEIEQL